MRRFLPALFRARTVTRPHPRPAPTGLRLGVTPLEDRLTPADLLAGGLTTPLPVVAAGAALPVQFAVVNVGTAATGGWSDRVLLSADAVAGAGDVTLGTTSFAGSLGQNGSYARSVSGVVPSSTPTGLRYLIGTADAANQLAETSESNNARAVPLVVLPPSLAGAVRTTVARLQTAIGGSLVPTAVTGGGAAATAVTFTATASTAYQIGGYRLTDLRATVTVTPAGAVTVTGSGNLRVPTGVGSTVAVPLTFTATPTALAVRGSVRVTSFQFGTDPRVTASNATLQANLTVDLTTNAVTGSATASAAAVSIQMDGATVLTATNFQATVTSAGRLTASATGVSVLGGAATAANVSLAYSMASGRITGSVGAVTGAIGAVRVSAAGATLVVDPGSSDPLLSVPTATMTFPANGVAPAVTATGFRLGQTGEYEFDAVALTLPGQVSGGARITGTLSGEVRRVGTAIVVTLNGTAVAFGTPVAAAGELTAGSGGLFGFLTLRTAANSDVAVLGQNIGFAYTGTARLLVNTATVSRTITAGAVTRTLAAGTGRLVADGTLSAGGFTLAGVLDVTAGADNTARIAAAADLSLGQFGLLRTTGSGTVRVLPTGLVGSLAVTQVSVPAGGFALNGPKVFELNTTAATVDGIAPGAAVRAATGIGVGGFTVTGAVRVGFRNNPGTANDFYFAAVRGTVSLFGGAASATLAGEVRSNGFVRLAADTRLTLAESQTGGTGVSLAGALTVSLTRTSGTGAVLFDADFDGSVRWFGFDVADATASIDAAGHARVTGTVFGVDFMTWEFDL